MATDGTQVVAESNGNKYAIYWNTTSGASTILNPSSALSATVRGVTGNQEVGGATFSNQRAAILWNGGVASSAVNLTPTQVNGIFAAIAIGTDGTVQVGQVADASSNVVATYAAMWSGTPDSFVSLRPTNLTYIGGQSQAVSVRDGQEVGFGSLVLNSDTPERPLLWMGDNNNATDLLPTGYGNGVANDTNGVQQVGMVELTGSTDGRAMVWSGTADSAVDLQSFLPTTLRNSDARSIDAAGDVFGTANDVSGNTYVIEWSPVPEPSTICVLFAFIIGAGLFKRRREVGA